MLVVAGHHPTSAEARCTATHQEPAGGRGGASPPGIGDGNRASSRPPAARAPQARPPARRCRRRITPRIQWWCCRVLPARDAAQLRLHLGTTALRLPPAAAATGVSLLGERIRLRGLRGASVVSACMSPLSMRRSRQNVRPSVRPPALSGSYCKTQQSASGGGLSTYFTHTRWNLFMISLRAASYSSDGYTATRATFPTSVRSANVGSIWYVPFSPSSSLT